jgi:hypothetical protein
VLPGAQQVWMIYLGPHRGAPSAGATPRPRRRRSGIREAAPSAPRGLASESRCAPRRKPHESEPAGRSITMPDAALRVAVPKATHLRHPSCSSLGSRTHARDCSALS